MSEKRVIVTENGEQIVLMRHRHGHMVKLIMIRETAITSEVTLTEYNMRELVEAWLESERVHD